MGEFGDRLRRLQEQSLARYFERRGIEPQIPPGAVTLLLASVGQVLVLEATIGMSNAHAETAALVESYLRRLEGAGGALLDLPVVPDGR
jgi:hypothetical protein